MAALLTIEAANTDKLAMYLGECRDLGVPILPPDINSSELAFTVVNGGRALRPVRGEERRRGRDPVDARPCARSSAASIRCITLCEHVDLRLVNKRVLESLIKAGALDSLAPATGTAVGAPRPAVRRGRQAHRARRPPSARPRQGAASAVRRLRRTTERRRRSRCPTRRRGPRRSSSRSRRRRSAST